MRDSISSAISYIISVPNWQPEDATPLAGFSFELCNSAFLVRAVSHLPSNIYELVPERHESLSALRMSGMTPILWYPQSAKTIKSEPVPIELPFTLLLLGPGQNPMEFRDWAQRCPVPPTIVSEEGGDLNYADLTLTGLQRQLLAVCELLSGKIDIGFVNEARDAISRWKPLPTRTLPYVVGGHATIVPNLMALSVCGYDISVSNPFSQIGDGIQPYVDQIILTTRSVLEERQRLGATVGEATFPRRPILNLFAPAMWAAASTLQLKATTPSNEKKSFQLAKNALQRQSGYGFVARTQAQIQALIGFPSAELSSGKAAPEPHFLIRIRQLELALSTDAVGALAASEVSAVVRLPNEVNRTAGAVRQFATHYRSMQSKPFRRAESFRQVQSKISSAVPDDIKNIITETDGEIRVISDAHLEWLDYGGLPLCIQRNLSRIPVTPGNLFIEQITSRPIIRFTPTDLQKVLVISALKRGDPIQGLFEVAFSVFSKQWKDKIQAEFVEVGSTEELITALNSFEGAIVIFDGHGVHMPNQPAVLMLKDEVCDVWELRNKIKNPPPIVILSACDTHAADRNHATTANGFLSLGTRAVLGSVFPLEAQSAAAFAARLIYRVAAFVRPAVGMFDRALTWTEIVSGMIRMQLLTDFLRLLERKKIIDGARYIDIGNKGNFLINSGIKNPFLGIISILEDLGLKNQQIWQELRLAVANSSAISYVNMGRPETIIVDTDERVAKQERDISESAN